MAKSAIRKLKDRRFWRWLCVEVYGRPAPKQPIKLNRKRVKFRKRRFNQLCDRAWKRVQAQLEAVRQQTAVNARCARCDGDIDWDQANVKRDGLYFCQGCVADGALDEIAAREEQENGC